MTRQDGEACPGCGRVHAAGPNVEHSTGRRPEFYPEPINCECGKTLFYNRPWWKRTLTGYEWLTEPPVSPFNLIRT